MRLRLPDGRLYDQAGQLKFVNNTITQGTDTITLRGVVPNPVLHEPTITNAPLHELANGQFVTVLLEGVQPVEYLVVPRSAVFV